MNFFNYFLFFFLLCLFSCKKKVRDFAQFKSWFNKEENGFLMTRDIDDLIFKVQYRPIDLQILNDLNENQEYTSHEINQIKDTYRSSKYFLLEIAIKDTRHVGVDVINKSEDRYKDFISLIEKMSFQLNENVELVVGYDTISPSIYHYERGYELGKRERFLFAFPISDTSSHNEMTFIYRDQLFNASILKFKFQVDEKDIPKLPVKIKES